MSRRADIQKLLANRRRRLQKLREQQALYGISAEPRVLIEIEDIEAEVEGLQAELAALPETDESPSAFPSSGAGSPGPRGGARYINTGGGAYIEGAVNTAGGDFVGRDKTRTGGLSAADIAALFAPIYERIDSRPGTGPEDKADLKSDLGDVEAEVKKREQADESVLSRRLRNIQRMAPDILEVVVATLTGPLAGLSTAARKVAERMRSSAGES